MIGCVRGRLLDIEQYLATGVCHTKIPAMSSGTGSEVYVRLLLPKGHGVPMWSPELDEKLPEEYQKEGVSIGDVGLLTPDGGFDFLFNICIPADHPINGGRVPAGFETVTNTSLQISEKSGYHRPGADIASDLTTRKTLGAGAGMDTNAAVPVALGGGFNFTWSSAEGAVLILPDGGSRNDLLTKRPFLQQALKNGLIWYEYANNERGRITTDGVLCLVTGCDKATSWGLASFSNPSGGAEVSLDFKVAQVVTADVSFAYQWASNCSADVRVDPISQKSLSAEQLPARQALGSGRHGGRHHRQRSRNDIQESTVMSQNPDADHDQHVGTVQRLNNQCVFIRGYRISVRKRFFPFPRSKDRAWVKAHDASDMTTMGVLHRSAIASASSPGSSTKGWRGIGSNSTGTQAAFGPAPQDLFEQLSISEDLDDDEILDMVPDVLQSHDPLAVLNNWLLDRVPEAEVAVTHDDHLYALMEKNEATIPADDEIIRRASQKFDCLVNVSVGGVSVEEKRNSDQTFRQVSSGQSTSDLAGNEPNSAVPAAVGFQTAQLSAGEGVDRKSSIPPLPRIERSTVPSKADSPPTIDAMAASTGHGRPDQKAYQDKQDALKTQIDEVQVQLNAVKAQIDVSGKGGWIKLERHTQLRKEKELLAQQLGPINEIRGNIRNQIKRSEDVIRRKVDMIKAAKANTPCETVAEIDDSISALEAEIAYSASIAAPKLATEISNLRLIRQTLVAIQTDEDTIQTERAKIDGLRQQLDNPQQKIISDKYDAVAKELDAIQMEGDEVHANRDKLFEQRNALQAKVDFLWQKKQEEFHLHREANDRYRAKVTEERQKRDQQHKERKAVQDAERLREGAQAPAYRAQMEECRTLIYYFTRVRESATPALPSAAPPQLAGNRFAMDEALRARQKQEREKDYDFVRKDVKSVAKGTSSFQTEAKSRDTQLELPYGTLTALAKLGISPPSTINDIPETIRSLKMKSNSYFAAQQKMTQENIANAQVEIGQTDQGLDESGTTGNGKVGTSGTTREISISTSDAREIASNLTFDALADASTAVTSKIGSDKSASTGGRGA